MSDHDPSIESPRLTTASTIDMQTQEAMRQPRGLGAPKLPLRLPRDDDRVLAMLWRPPPPWSLKGFVMEVCDGGREHLVRRAIEEGVVRLEGHGEVVIAVAARGSVSLLRFLIRECGIDRNHRNATFSRRCSLRYTATPIVMLCT